MIHDHENPLRNSAVNDYGIDTFSDEGASRNLIDFRAISDALARRKWWFLGGLLIVLAATAASYILIDKSYDATTLVGLERKEDRVINTPSDGNANILLDMPSVDTEVTVLLSPDVVRSAVERNKLNEDQAFVQAATDGKKDAPITIEEASSRIESTLSAQRQGASYVIELSYSSGNPDIAAWVVNAVASAYLNRQVSSAELGRTKDISLLEDRLEGLRNSVIDAESAVARYKAANSLVPVEGDGTAAQDEIGNLNTQLAQARAELAAAQGVALANSSDSGTLVSSSELIRSLRLEAAKLSAEQARLAESYGPNYPDRVKVETQLASIRSDLARETSRMQEGITNDVTVASSRVNALERALRRAQGQLVSGNNASVRLNELERVAQSSRDLYEAFLERYRAALATAGTDKSRAYIIAKASVPQIQSTPNPILFALIGIMGGLAVGGGAVFFLEAREKGVLVREDAERHFGLPVIAAIPDLATVKDISYKGGQTADIANYVVNHDGSVFNEAFRSIRTALRIGQPRPVAQTVVITSTSSDEGKTTCAICLARTSALAGIPTLLIDADTRRAATTRSMSIQTDAGLLEVLDGNALLDSVLLQDEATGMYILPQKFSKLPNFDLLQSTKMEQLLLRLKSRFELIIIDTAPVLPVAETKALAAMADATMLVVRWRKTRVHNVMMTIQQLRRAEANLVGTLMTLVNLRATSMLRDDEMYYESYYAPN